LFKFRNILLGITPDMSSMYKGTRLEEEYPEMLVYLKLWSSNATILWGIHIFLGVLATFFSLLAAAGIGALLEEHTKVFAFIAAVSISLLTAFNLGAKSNNTRDAWRELNIAAIKFNRGQIGKDKLIKAYENGESRIGGVSFTQSSINAANSENTGNTDLAETKESQDGS
jgi:hypothetical protein